MKNIIIGLVIGLVLNGIIVFAKENIVMNSIQKVGDLPYSYYDINTTKVTTPEGTYRIFTSQTSTGAGITAVKIK